MRDVQSLQTPGTADRKAEFRQLMGLFTTGVCVVSVRSGDDTPAAMTVNSFVSVSLEPMVVGWSLQNRSSQFDLYAAADSFSVSILADSQAPLAKRYAARGDSQLRGDDFTTGQNNMPVIAGAIAYLECRRWSDFLVGDHTMIFGEVVGMNAAPTAATGFNQPGSPLGFFNGQFCSIGS